MRRARWILAPLLAPLTMWCLVACDLPWPDGRTYWRTSKQAWMFLALLFAWGAPIALLATGLVGVPAVKLLERRGRSGPGWFGLTGALAGLLVGLAFTLHYASKLDMSLSRVPIRSTLRTLLLCAETGLVSGIAFGLLGGRGAR